MRRPWSLALPSAAAGLIGLVAACGGSSGGGGGPFVLLSINLPQNAIWPLNRRIVMTFSTAVKPSSVSFSSVLFASATAPPVTGTFLVDPCSNGTTVLFQPECPSNDLLDNGGFQPNGVNYTLTLLSGSGPNTIRSKSGKPLATGIVVNFKSPTIGTADPVLFDTKPTGPPVPTAALPLSIGLNTLSNPIAPIQVGFDQSIDPRSSNLAPGGNPRVVLEYEDPPGSFAWLPVPSTLSLVANCTFDLSACPTADTATLSIVPSGILPAGRALRVRVLSGLADMGGNPTTMNQVVATSTVVAPSAAPPYEGDVLDESFETTDREDAVSPVAADPSILLAEWGSGRLLAAVPFPSGPNACDLVVGAGQTLILDTTFDTVICAGGGNIDVVAGVLHVDDLTVEATGRIEGQGPNPLVVFATGTVTVNGTISVEGGKAENIQFSNMANLPEAGGLGGPGGGRGGNGSANASQSTQVGEAGWGPSATNPAVLAPGQGGGGGHSCFGIENADSRRGAGGSGGSFSTFGATGVAGGPLGVDAVNGAPGAEPGVLGPIPFTSDASTLKFFGRKLMAGAVLTGELLALRGGTGGGAGGDTIGYVTPVNPEFATGDDKGGPGGGGGGVLVIRAVGGVSIGAMGVLTARGGGGGGGETIGGSSNNRVGGGGGGGSGGMVVVESLTSISVASGTAGNERIRVKGGARGLGAGEPPVMAGAPPSAAGGVGGDGIIQLHPPNGQSVLLSGLPVTSLGTPTVDTPAQILLPEFGLRSRARSEWIDTGFASLGNAVDPALQEGPFYEWVVSQTLQPNDPGNPNNTTNANDPGYPLDPTGNVTANMGFVEPGPLVPIGDLPNASFQPNQATIPLAAIQAAGFPGPAAFGGYDLAPNVNDLVPGPVPGTMIPRPFTIVSAVVTGAPGAEQIVLQTDPADGPMTPVPLPTTPAAIRARYFLVRTGGVEHALPAGAVIQVRFEGADAISPSVVGSTGFTSDLDALDGKRFVRYQVLIDLTALGPASASVARPELDFFKLPIRF